MIALTEEGEITSIQGFRDCVHEEWTRGLLADIEGKTVSGEKGLTKATEAKNYAQGVLNGCDAGTWRQLRQTGKRLVAALLYRSHTPSNGVQTVFGIK